MGEDGKNISDDMSSLLHAAEEWANERLFGINSSNDLDDSISYVPIYVPIEEVARQAVLEICKIYNWNPKTGADNRLSRRNADDTTPIQQSSEVPILHNIFQDVIVSSSTMKLNKSNSTAISKILSSTKCYHEQETLLDTFQPLATTCDDVVNKTFTVRRNSLCNIPEQLDAPDQVIHDNNTINKTTAVKRNTSLNKLEQLDMPDHRIHSNNTINKTFTVRRNSSCNIPKQLDAPDQLIHDYSKQKSTALQKVTIFPAMDTISSLADSALYSSKISTVENAEKNTHISSGGSFPDTANKNRISNSDEHPENMEQKFLPTAPKKLILNPTLDITLSPVTIDYRQFSDNNLITSTPHIKSLEEIQKVPEMLAITNSVSNDISSRNIANKYCATNSKDIITANDTVTFSFPNETINETIANEIIRPTFSKTNEIIQSSLPKPTTSVNDIRINIRSLPENDMSNPRTVIIANTTLQQFPHYPVEKEKNLPVTNSMQINESRNDVSYRTLSEENRALIIKLDEKLSRLQINNSPSLSVIRKSENLDFISTMTATHPEKCLLTVAGNPNLAVGEFENTALVVSPKINNTTQIESSTDPYDSKNYANLEKNINVEDTSQKQLITDNKDMDSTIDVVARQFVADNQKMIMNNISSLSENEHSFKDITGKQFITRAIQTDQESGYERSNKLCNKFSRNASLPVINNFDDKIIEQTTTTKKSFLDEPIKFFNYMSSPVRRKSLPTPRSVFNFNKPNKFLTQSIKRPQTIREIIRNTPTMMTPKSTAKSNIKQSSKSVHSVRSINPPKKPNELPLENRASRLKAEYLAKERAKKAAEQSKMVENKKLTSAMVGSLSVLRKKSPSVSKNPVRSNNNRRSSIPISLNAKKQFSTFTRNALSPISEMTQSASQKHGKL